MRLFEQVGTVTLERRGLYFAFHARIRRVSEGYIRLYYHAGGRSVRMGLFGEREDGFVCLGSISARQLSMEEGGVFSVTDTPWLPALESLDGGLVVPGAVFCRMGELRRIAIPDGEMPPSEIMPFFCFLAPEMIEGLPCLSIWVDGQGRPVVPELSL